jgi:hypothetical protein
VGTTSGSRVVLQAVVLVVACLGTASSIRSATVEPWASDRAAWCAAAAGRATAFDGTLDLRKLPELFETPIPEKLFRRRDPLPADVASELHVVANYIQPKPIVAEDGRVTVVPIEVKIRRTDRPVVVVLTSFESVVWRVALEPDATLDAVHYSCFKRCRVDVPAGVPAPQELVRRRNDDDRVETYDYASDGGPRTLEAISQAVGLPVMSAQGPNTSGAFAVPIERDRAVLADVYGARAAVVDERTVRPPAPFLLVDGDAIVRVGDGKGPPGRVVPKRRVRLVTATTPDGDYYALAIGSLVRVDRNTGEVESVEIPADLPRLSWSGGLAYDERTARIVVTQASPIGVHHLYDPKARTWETIPVERSGGPLVAATYMPRTKTLYAVRIDRQGATLVQLDDRLEPLGSSLVPAEVLQFAAAPQMASAGELVAFCRSSHDLSMGRAGARCCYVDPVSGKAGVLRIEDVP